MNIEFNIRFNGEQFEVHDSMSRTNRYCFSLDEVFARVRLLLTAELSVARGRADGLEKALAPDTRNFQEIAE